MTTAELKHIVSHPHWYEDLPARDSPPNRPPKMVHGDINAMDSIYLEVSRASTIMRGIGIFFGALGLLGFSWVLFFMLLALFPIDDETFIFIFFWPIALLIAVYSVLLSLRLDISIPRDRPVRFNRINRKIYVYEAAYGMNPFRKWPTTIKIFDWNTLRAELHRQAGSNGKAYVQRFSLWLVSYKPDTNEVVDLFELKGNHPTRAELYDTWAYCRHYMEQGGEDLPMYSTRRQGVSFRRSLFEYIRFLDPTEEGREERAQMRASEWIFNTIITLLVFWLLIPWGIGHYIAMRFAPDVSWPPDIDAESRSA